MDRFGNTAGLLAAVFPGRHDLDTFKKRVYLLAGNALVAPLVLHGVVGGGDHLPSGDPNARLPCLFHKKKIYISIQASARLYSKLGFRDNINISNVYKKI